MRLKAKVTRFQNQVGDLLSIQILSQSFAYLTLEQDQQIFDNLFEMFNYSITSLHLPKLGNEEVEYEDASAYPENKYDENQTLRVAVADGATESSFSAEWADMLSKCYVGKQFNDIQELRLQVDLLSKDWQSNIDVRQLTWFAEEKARMGAFSTLLGLEIYSNSTEIAGWHSIAVGDSCLFQIRNNSLEHAFPIQHSSDFNNSPILISSKPEKNRQHWDKALIRCGNWQAGDFFFLTTDALAAWFIHEYELSNLPWEILIKFIDDNEYDKSFKLWVNELRASSSMKNDDVTCLIIKL